MISRRASFAGLAAAGLAGLALPAVTRAAARVLRLVPHAALVSLDPAASTANITRNHGFMVYDTLYGMSSALEPSPQMAEGHAMDYGGRRAVIFLRPGLRFHDGQPVLARDVVASLSRWMARTPFGQKLASATSSLSALDDRRVQIVLRRPFPLLFHGLASLSQPPFVMPERVARTDPATPIEDATGSGPFRFKRDEFTPGLAVYERNPAYEPIAEAPSLTAGGKVVNFDRVEWRVMADPAAAAAALQQGEVDWYEQPPAEAQAVLRRNRAILVERINPLPNMAMLRLNHRQPPFDDVAVRRALLSAVDQREFMSAVVGPEVGLGFTDVGVYTPGSPNASRLGLDPLLGLRSPEQTRDALAQAGVGTAAMRLIGPVDMPAAVVALTQVAAKLFQRLGLSADVALSDWASVIERRTSQAPLNQGGWSALVANFSGFDCIDPATHPLLRGNGAQGWPGWPAVPRLETLRDEWFAAEEPADRTRLAGEIQRVAIDEVAVIPLGAYLQPTALRRNLVDRVPGFAILWGLRSV